MDLVEGERSPSLQSLFSGVAKVVEKREKELDARELDLQRERKAFEEEKSLFGAGKGGPSDVLRLNVGGTHMDVLRRTLTSVDGSMLASRFSGRWDDNLEKDKDGNFFIDQPLDLFEPLVDFLRRKNNESLGFPPPDPPDLERTFKEDRSRWRDFLLMIEYYNITHGIYTLNIEQCHGRADKIEPVFRPGLEIFSASLVSLRLSSSSRRVASFEVRVKKNVKEFCIGWSSEKPGEASPRIGSFEKSIAFDFVRFEKHHSGSVQGLDKSSFEFGDDDSVVIRCERDGLKFFLNGQELFGDPTNAAKDSPAISGVGRWQIVKVTYYDCSSEQEESFF